MLKLVGPADPLRMVLVRDMWLIGFDAPSLRTMYDALGVNDSVVQVLARPARAPYFLLDFMKPPRYGGGHGDSESSWAQPAG